MYINFLGELDNKSRNTPDRPVHLFIFLIWSALPIHTLREPLTFDNWIRNPENPHADQVEYNFEIDKSPPMCNHWNSFGELEAKSREINTILRVRFLKISTNLFHKR